MKLILTLALTIVAANVLTGCCCPCGYAYDTGGFALGSEVAPQAKAVAEHVVARANAAGEQKF